MLVITPDGSARAERLPHGARKRARAMQHLVGGAFAGITRPVPQIPSQPLTCASATGVEVLPPPPRMWVAYMNFHGRERDMPVNERATLLARVLGWSVHPGVVMHGPVAFLGLRAAQEVDVPHAVLHLGRLAGVITTDVTETVSAPELAGRGQGGPAGPVGGGAAGPLSSSSRSRCPAAVPRAKPR